MTVNLKRAYGSRVGRKRISDEQWQQVVEAYNEWDPSDPDAPNISDLIRSHGMSKQAFYARLQRAGTAPKQVASHHQAVAIVEPVDQTHQVINGLLEMLVEARVRVQVLEQFIIDHGISMPGGPLI